MRIQFCGANRTVTGSCHLLEVNGRRIVLDVGMYQGPREEARQLNQYVPDGLQKADAIILSHGHLDHCGKIPVLTRSGYHGPIYCTAATAEVARIVLEDAAEIQEEDAEYLNRRAVTPDEPPIRPLYVRSDIPKLLQQIRRVKYNQKVDLGNDVSFTLFDAGHILGSAYVVVEWREDGQTRTLLFTADIGRYDSPIIRDPEVVPGPVDHVITESTYGDRSHAPIADVEPQLLDAVKWCIQKKSRLIVPAFAVGRTQVVLWYMQKFISEGKIPQIPIYVDSPMGVEASRVHQEFRENYDEETREMIGKKDLFGLARVHFAASRKESQRINGENGPCVIIASSPTCEFGRVLHHLKRSIERHDDMVIFVGWTPSNTLGRRIQDGTRRIRIYDRWYDLKCQTRTIHGLSAHADAEEILRFLKPTLVAQTTVHVVHGEAHQSEGLAQRLVQAGAGMANIPAIESSVWG
jgi:metallo-beta-lactamase family protein